MCLFLSSKKTLNNTLNDKESSTLKKEGKKTLEKTDLIQKSYKEDTQHLWCLKSMEEEEDKEEKRPLRTKDDALNPENVKAEKLRSKDVLDDVLNAVRVCACAIFK